MTKTMRLSVFAGALALLLAVVPARAQLVQGFGGGLNVAGPSLNVSDLAERYQPGFSARVFVCTHTARRLSPRFDLSVTRLSLQQTHYVYADGSGPICWGRCPVTSGGAPVGIIALTANAVATLTGPSRGGQVYLTAGVGPYYLYQHPDVGNAVRVGAATGIGWVLPWGGRSRFFVEARYERLIHSPAQLSWTAPITVGLRL